MEIVNQYLDQKLQPFVNYFQDNQAKLLPIIDYAHATLLYDTTRFAPIQIEMGYLLRTSFDWDRPIELQTIYKKLSYKEAQQYVKRLEQAQKVACKNIEKVQQLIERIANKYQQEPNFDIGDSMQVTTKNWKIDQPSCKLDYQMAGLYLIFKKVGNSYRVNLLETIKVYLVFLLDKLQKASKDLLLG